MLQLVRIQPQPLLPCEVPPARYRSAHPLPLRPPLEHRLEQLEQQIRSYAGNEPHADWLNEYLDLGLEMACVASERQLQPLQESWLNRLYNTLRDAAVNPAAGSHWRHLCLDYLYQPFFVLSHLYRQQPGRSFRLRSLLHEFAMLSRIG